MYGTGTLFTEGTEKSEQEISTAQLWLCLSTGKERETLKLKRSKTIAGRLPPLTRLMHIGIETEKGKK